jgi:formylglycine-generating enzyme required for sulfatase activity
VIRAIRQRTVTWWRVVALLLATACTPGADRSSIPDRWIDPVTGMELVLVGPGAFRMGLSRQPDELRPAPPHEVRLTRPFYLGRFEVTQGQWRRVTGRAPSRFAECGDRCPVESVSWLEVQAFLARLNELSPGQRYRLPTEAEWEYACRAGSDARYGGVVDTLRPHLANYDSRIPFDGVADTVFVGSPTPVGSYAANAVGLHDMAANVWEWTDDEYCPYGTSSVDPRGRCGTDTIVIRGGSWYFSADAARCGRRYTHHRGDSGFSLGPQGGEGVPSGLRLGAARGMASPAPFVRASCSFLRSRICPA